MLTASTTVGLLSSGPCSKQKTESDLTKCMSDMSALQKQAADNNGAIEADPNIKAQVDAAQNQLETLKTTLEQQLKGIMTQIESITGLVSKNTESFFKLA